MQKPRRLPAEIMHRGTQRVNPRFPRDVLPCRTAIVDDAGEGQRFLIEKFILDSSRTGFSQNMAHRARSYSDNASFTAAFILSSPVFATTKASCCQ